MRAGQPALEHGDVLTVAGVGIVAEQVDDRLLGVARTPERVTEEGRCSAIGGGVGGAARRY